MSNSPQPKPPNNDGARAIPKWADRYARSRVLPGLVAMADVMLVCAVVALCIGLLIRTHRFGSAAEFGTCLAVAAVVAAIITWLILTKRLHAAAQTLCARLLESDGQVVAREMPRINDYVQPMVNVYVPLVAYLVVAAVAVHVHGRFALRRLRRLAHSLEADEAGDETHE